MKFTKKEIKDQIDYLKHLKEDYDSIWVMCGTIAFVILIAIITFGWSFNIFPIIFSSALNSIDSYMNIIFVIGFFSCIIMGGYVTLRSNKCYREINKLYRPILQSIEIIEPNKNIYLNKLYELERTTKGFNK